MTIRNISAIHVRATQISDASGNRVVEQEGNIGYDASVTMLSLVYRQRGGITYDSAEARHTTAVSGLARIDNVSLEVAGIHQLLFSATAPGMQKLPVAERAVSVLPGLPAIARTTVECPTLTVGRAVNCSLVLHDACDNPITVQPCSSAPRTCIRPVGSTEAESIGVHISFKDAAGQMSDLELFQGTSEEAGVILQILTSYAGPATVAIMAETASGNQSVSQLMQVQPADIDPQQTSFDCSPSPIVAGSRLMCVVTTRGKFGNAAGGADAANFAISGFDAAGQTLDAVPDGELIPVGARHSAEFHAFFFPRSAGVATISLSFHFGGALAKKKALVDVLPAAPDPERLSLKCSPILFEFGKKGTECEVSARDAIGNSVRIDPANVSLVVSGNSEPSLSPVRIMANHSECSFKFDVTSSRIGTGTVSASVSGSGVWKNISLRTVASLNDLLPVSLLSSLFTAGALRWDWVGGFFLIVISAEILGRWMQRELHFPLITGYLIVGVLAGPQLLGLVQEHAFQPLEFIDAMALGFIGFSAGAKFSLNEMAVYYKSVLSVMTGLVLVTFLVCTAASFALSPIIPFMEEMSTLQRFACSLLFGCLAVARSPASAIALISELHARGPFTTVMLAVTVVMDMFVIVLFTLTLVAVNMMQGDSNNDVNLGQVLGFFLLQLVLSAVGGAAMTYLLKLLLSFAPRLRGAHSHDVADVLPAQQPAPSSVTGLPPPPERRKLTRKLSKKLAKQVDAITDMLHGSAKQAFSETSVRLQEYSAARGRLRRMWILLLQLIVLGIGFTVFAMESVLTEAADGASFFQPLVLCMLGGFGVCNFTQHRDTFLALLEGIAGAVYALFFTLAGAKLDLAAVPSVLPIALLIFCARASGIVMGSALGCYASGQPREWTKHSWMAFMTQAGVTLGLAAKVSKDFSWGPDFSAAVVAVVVLNQVVGPPLFKYAIIHIGEAFATAEVSGLSALNVPKGVLIVHERDDPLCTELVDLLTGNGFEVLCAEQRHLRRGPLSPLSRVGTPSQSFDSIPLLEMSNPQSGEAAVGSAADKVAPSEHSKQSGMGKNKAGSSNLDETKRASSPLAATPSKSEGCAPDGRGNLYANKDRLELGLGLRGEQKGRLQRVRAAMGRYSPVKEIVGHLRRSSESDTGSLFARYSPNSSAKCSMSSPRPPPPATPLNPLPETVLPGNAADPSVGPDPERIAELLTSMEDARFLLLLLDRDSDNLEVCRTVSTHMAKDKCPTSIVRLIRSEEERHFQQLVPQPVCVISSLMPLLPELITQLIEPTPDWSSTMINLLAHQERALHRLRIEQEALHGRFPNFFDPDATSATRSRRSKSIGGRLDFDAVTGGGGFIGGGGILVRNRSIEAEAGRQAVDGELGAQDSSSGGGSAVTAVPPTSPPTHRERSASSPNKVHQVV
ncbi:hypothetical protein AB1Y20_019827 [Prymnesium parvum]|uniref:Cation/H+ exchanger transmembrane domain-containing protein n=1 Tax=Prymnesium parvum TaxID=97485 RepID=A0AB34JVG6_PRYPA